MTTQTTYAEHKNSADDLFLWLCVGRPLMREQMRKKYRVLMNRKDREHVE
jgi:hypothetical protein